MYTRVDSRISPNVHGVVYYFIQYKYLWGSGILLFLFESGAYIHFLLYIGPIYFYLLSNLLHVVCIRGLSGIHVFNYLNWEVWERRQPDGVRVPLFVSPTSLRTKFGAGEGYSSSTLYVILVPVLIVYCIKLAYAVENKRGRNWLSNIYSLSCIEFNQ